MDPSTRRIIGFALHSGDVDGPALCRMFNLIIAGQQLPQYLSSDHSPLIQYHRWQANLRVLGIKEVKTVPYVPLSYAFVDRLIGTVRREFLSIFKVGRCLSYAGGAPRGSCGPPSLQPLQHPLPPSD